MLLHEALYKQLTTATLTTKLGSTAIYPIMIPQGVNLPAVTYQEISESPVHAMGADPSLMFPRFEISSWSSSYKQVKIIADSVKSVLRDFGSTKLGGAAAGVYVQRIFFENETDFLDIDRETGTMTFHVAQDYIIWSAGG